ncbi:hypothetical protein M758_12G105300 [Ceratodon purpureus]|nr:hypothetical protein M758_12G105300 [Ceratodon purpureus]
MPIAITTTCKLSTLTQPSRYSSPSLLPLHRPQQPHHHAPARTSHFLQFSPSCPSSTSLKHKLSPSSCSAPLHSSWRLKLSVHRPVPRLTMLHPCRRHCQPSFKILSTHHPTSTRQLRTAR